MLNLNDCKVVINTNVVFDEIVYWDWSLKQVCRDVNESEINVLESIAQFDIVNPTNIKVFKTKSLVGVYLNQNQNPFPWLQQIKNGLVP